MIDGVKVTPLKRINNDKGDIYHALKASDEGFSQFGEAYFSTIYYGDIKGWKKHYVMELNLIVPVGAIKFVVYDDRPGSSTHGVFQEFTISPDNYYRLTVAPNLWVAFQGVNASNMLLNIASIEHNPKESVSLQVDALDYSWGLI